MFPRPALQSPNPVDAPAILIVDDDPDMRLYLRSCLRGLGAAAGIVIDAADGIEALQRIRAGGVGLVISDVVLPRMNGAELRRTIRSDPVHAQLPVLLISGEPEAASPAAIHDAFLKKPFNAHELLTAARGLLRVVAEGS
jgi:two-component system, chemotaxis family, chemotaxis protein CheY